VRSTGDVVVTGGFGTKPALAGRMLYEGGYSYAVELPVGTGWVYSVNCQFVDRPPEGWGELS